MSVSLYVSGKERLGSVIYDLGIPISRAFSTTCEPRVATVTTLLCRLTSPSNCTDYVCMFGQVMCVWMWNACVNAREQMNERVTVIEGGIGW